MVSFPQTMFEHWKNSLLSFLFEIGLGGTSLLNANVFLEADDETLQIKSWPAEIREKPGCLRECMCFAYSSQSSPKQLLTGFGKQIMTVLGMFCNLRYILMISHHYPN